MIALRIEDIKIFMNKLFKDSTFDEFEVISMELSQAVKYTIDGFLNLPFFDTSEKEVLDKQEYIKWSQLKQNIFPLIRGNKTPTSMKIVFSLSNYNKANLIQKSNSSFKADDINGFYMNIQYDHTELKVITGTNYKLFTLDKSIEQYFDETIKKFFTKHEIPNSLFEN